MIIKRWIAAIFGSAVLIGGVAPAHAEGEVKCQINKQRYEFRPIPGKKLSLGKYLTTNEVPANAYMKLGDIDGESQRRIAAKTGAVVKCGGSTFIKFDVLVKHANKSGIGKLARVAAQPYYKSADE